jgi:hypothetical protein
VCQTAVDAVDQAALDRLHGKPTDLFNSHALLSRLKTAAALALHECRADAITKEDWQLAGVVHGVSDNTRQRMIDVLKHSKTENNRSRADQNLHVDILEGAHATDTGRKRYATVGP